MPAAAGGGELMGNTKVYTVRFPLRSGEYLITKEELAEAAISSDVMVDKVGDGEESMAMIMVSSRSMNADEFVSVIRTRYPDRWCEVTRYDVDWSDFQVTEWSADGTSNLTVFEPVSVR